MCPLRYAATRGPPPYPHSRSLRWHLDPFSCRTLGTRGHLRSSRVGDGTSTAENGSRETNGLGDWGGMLLEVVGMAWKKQPEKEREAVATHIFLYFSPWKNWGKIFSHFDYGHIFPMGWFNHQLVVDFVEMSCLEKCLLTKNDNIFLLALQLGTGGGGFVKWLHRYVFRGEGPLQEINS